MKNVGELLIAKSIALALACIGLLGCVSRPKLAAQAVHLSLPSEHYRLPNGLDVVIHRDAGFDAAIVDVRYHVGSKDDPQGQSGFAHLHEHLTFRSKPKNATDTLGTLIESSDVLSFNAFTNTDATEYFECIPPTQLPRAMWIEAMRMSSPLDGVIDDVFVRERDVVKNEYRQNYETRPYGFVTSIARAGLFPPGHPYHLPVIGDPHDLDRSTLEDARAFATRFYTPRNATLVVAGNIDIDVTRGLVGRYFGALPPGREPPPPRTFAFPVLPADKIIRVEADVEAPRLVIAWALPAAHAKSFYEARLLAADLGGTVAAGLKGVLEMADSVSHTLSEGRLGSMFYLTVTLRRGAKPTEALAAIDSILPLVTSSFVRRAASLVVPDSEFWLGESVSAIADLRDRATRIQDFVEFFGWPDAAEYDLARHRAARRAGVGSAAAFFDAHKVVVMVKQVPGAPRAGRVVQ